ncbi:hypothetical protein [Leptospira sarikeiensis]|uniref:Rad50/SbcC-type AAA domain-containing protein n=1 Tax=Leptospira sarikeiensis TaxID=2484943 RepID=A0A4R9KF19_9LEPT|nr:hypothetical protein [Leptospira sarikeiensis]TGL65951.1 hypothetical protein EHQ64_00050 [Leptospira sarikeiensis]
MNNAIRNEFEQWIISLKDSSLNEIQTKLLNLLISNFDTILPLGTAKSQRAKKIAELIEKNRSTLAADFPLVSPNIGYSTDRINNISELEIGPFRGFNSSEKFSFDTNFTFLYGPNGSGKSSFCEGLEYALLDEIEEASAKRILIKDYIKNTSKQEGKKPIVYTKNGDRNEAVPVQANQILYKFSFIEKNRIDAFARITATTNSDQKDRIATLFGLDSFSDFVDGFTNNFAPQLTLEPKLANEFSESQKTNNENIAKLKEVNESIAVIAECWTTLFKEINNSDVSTKESLKIFLKGEDGVSGKIYELQQLKASEIQKDIVIENFSEIQEKVSGLIETSKTITKKLTEFQINSSDLNFNDLYSALIGIKDISADKCPACDTPLTQVVINPFQKAITEIEKLKSLSKLQEDLPSLCRSAVKDINILNIQINKVNTDITSMNIKEILVIPFVSDVEYIDIKNVPTWLPTLSEELNSVLNALPEITLISERISSFNLNLQEKRTEKEKVDTEIQKFEEYETRRVELSTQEIQLNKEKSEIESSISKFNEENSEKLVAIENEKLLISEFNNYIEAYDILIGNLKNYRDKLPVKLSFGLSEKALEYYNIINQNDPEFEKLDFLSIPSTPGDKIEIRFKGIKNKEDALHILSEGHIKVLGLSILLSKISNDNLGFIIFDDVVNAIDDDHRSGIAELLTTHPDFKTKQQIITSHGEQFINKLEHKLGASAASKLVRHYRFFPSDSIEYRGIKVSTGDTKHYILQAEENYTKNSLKDAASKCRQAVESLSETIWKKIIKERNINLTVKIRSPGFQPELSTVVDSLIKELKAIDPNTTIFNKLKELKEKYPWSILNKGTHEQDDLPEFERSDIKNVIEIIKEIDTGLFNFSLTTVVK